MNSRVVYCRNEISQEDDNNIKGSKKGEQLNKSNKKTHGTVLSQTVN